MDGENTAVIDASDIIDDSLVQDVNMLKETLEAYDSFNLDNLRIDLYKNYGIVVIPLKKQYLINDLTDKLVQILNVNILYSTTKKDGRVCRTITYSQPQINSMYIIGLESEMYGIVDEMSVTFFYSIDVMFTWLRDILESIQKSCKVCYKQNSVELYRIFM